MESKIPRIVETFQQLSKVTKIKRKMIVAIIFVPSMARCVKKIECKPDISIRRIINSFLYVSCVRGRKKARSECRAQ